MRGLFRILTRTLARSGSGRWVLTILLLLIGVLLLGGSFTMTGDNALDLLAGGIFFLICGLALLTFLLLMMRRTSNAREAGEAHAKRLLAEGKLLPIPPLPKNPPKGASAEDLAQVESYAAQLRDIPWGVHQQIAAENARHSFDRAVAITRRVTGDWSQLSLPVKTFAALPAPLCNVGAAEVMFRLSYVRGKLYAPAGLRQGLRFTTHAQIHTPLQPDALVIQVKLLAACPNAYWQQLAAQTLALAEQAAPDHPRLANAYMFYHDMRGEYDQALVYADKAMADAQTSEDRYAALSRKALLLMDLKRYDEANTTYDLTLAEDPNNPWAWHNKSRALTTLGRYDDALACNQRALALMDFGMARKQREIILGEMAGN